MNTRRGNTHYKDLARDAVFDRSAFSLSRFAPLPAHVQELIAKREAGVQVSRVDVFALELALIDLVSEEELRLKVLALREELGRFFDAEGTKKLDIPALSKMTRKELQGEASALLEEIHQRRLSVMQFEEVRSWISIILIFCLALATNLMWWSLLYKQSWAAMAYSGFLGSGLSFLLRLRSLEWSPSFGIRAVSAHVLFWNFVSNLFLSFAIGMIAASVLLLFFASGLIEGSLCPTINGLSWNVSFSDPQLLKLFLWGVIAGFSEKLVPDKLSHLAASVPPKGRAS